RARRRGWILNIGSDSARQPPVPYRDTAETSHLIVAYGTSKAALNRYTEGLAHEVAVDGVFVNVVAPVAIVLTDEAERFAGHIAAKNPGMVEPVEVLVEAAVELVTGRHVGQVLLSRPFLHSIGRPVRTLDGTKVLGDSMIGLRGEG